MGGGWRLLRPVFGPFGPLGPVLLSRWPGHDTTDTIGTRGGATSGPLNLTRGPPPVFSKLT